MGIVVYRKGRGCWRGAGVTGGGGQGTAPGFSPKGWFFFLWIRPALPPDAAALAEVEALCFPAAEAAPEQQFRDRLQAYAGHFWLMFDGETLISFVDGMVTDQPDLTDDLYENAALHSETGAWQMIFGVVTRPEYRKHGLAAQLLNRAIADARQQGRKGLVLTCKDKLVHYYAKFGFVNEGVSQSTHGNVAWNQMRLTF